MNRKLKKVTAVLLVLMLAISVSVSTSLADEPAPINDVELFEELLSGGFEDELLAEELENSEPLDLEGETVEMEEEESELVQESALVDALGYSVTPLEELEGSGTRTDPYKLYTEADLRAVVPGKYYEMMNDITLSGTENNWTPIGAGRNGFTGQFDGRGHTIRNIQIDTDENDQGFFGSAGSGAAAGRIKNLNIKDSSIKGKNKVGGIVGNAIDAQIHGCSFEGSVTATGGTAGGIAGYLQTGAGFMEDCYNKGTVSGSVNAGGIAGEAYVSFVMNCHNEGDVYAGGFAGGIVGTNFVDLSQCLNTGNIFSMSTDTGSAGGIAGDERVESSSCVSAGSIVSSANADSAFRISPASSLYNNYALEDMLVNGSTVSGTVSSAHGQSITGEQLGSLEFYQTNLSYWDFENTWMIDPVKGHPVLQWTYEPEPEYITNAKDVLTVFIQDRDLGDYTEESTILNDLLSRNVLSYLALYLMDKAEMSKYVNYLYSHEIINHQVDFSLISEKERDDGDILLALYAWTSFNYAGTPDDLSGYGRYFDVVVSSSDYQIIDMHEYEDSYDEFIVEESEAVALYDALSRDGAKRNAMTRSTASTIKKTLYKAQVDAIFEQEVLRAGEVNYSPETAAALRAAASLNATAIVNYAKTNVSKPLPASGGQDVSYYDFSQIADAYDCTNFVSHALLAGGAVPYNTGNEASGWYYRGLGVNQKSHSWTGVIALHGFLTKNTAKGPGGTSATYTTDVSASGWKVGDILQCFSTSYLPEQGGGWRHSTIITGIEYKEMLGHYNYAEAKITGRSSVQYQADGTAVVSYHLNIPASQKYPNQAKRVISNLVNYN